MPNTHSHKTIHIADRGWHGAEGRLELRRAEEHFELDMAKKGNWMCKNMAHDEARALRDALIEIYPVETLKEKPAPYQVQSNPITGDWMVGRLEMQAYPVNIAYAATKEAAQRIADALNAQETA